MVMGSRLGESPVSSRNSGSREPILHFLDLPNPSDRTLSMPQSEPSFRMPPVPVQASPESLMRQEAAEAADVVQRQLDRNQKVMRDLATRLRNAPPRFVLTCARGSSGNAATYARYLLGTQMGLVTADCRLSIGSVYKAAQRVEGGLLLAISQSGSSPDLLHNARAAREAGALVVALVNVENSPLASVADLVLPLHAGAERSVAATKSYLASLSAISHIVATWSKDVQLARALSALPEGLRKAWVSDWSSLEDGLVDQQHVFIVGRGHGLAAAQEAALKLKETSGLHAEAYSAAEIKHGPMALIGRGTPILAFTQGDQTHDGTLALAGDLSSRGARVWVAGEKCPPSASHLATIPGIHPTLAPLLQVQCFYRVADALSRRRGFNPDAPPFLKKVTETI